MCGMKLLIHSQTSTVEVWEWIGNFILHFIMGVITYSCSPFTLAGPDGARAGEPGESRGPETTAAQVHRGQCTHYTHTILGLKWDGIGPMMATLSHFWHSSGV